MPVIWQWTTSRLSGTNAGEALSQTLNLPFYKALSFTLAHTGIVTPLVIVAGFIIALAVNLLPTRIKGAVIFFSLLPMIVTPLIGAVVIFG